MAGAEKKTVPESKPKEYMPPKVADAFIRGIAAKNLFKDTKPLPTPKKPS